MNLENRISSLKTEKATLKVIIELLKPNKCMYIVLLRI